MEPNTMPPFFESEPPFVIKVYDKYFQIIWENSLETPDDTYRFENVSALTIILGNKNDSLFDYIISHLMRSQLARRIEGYDSLLITFKNGETETRYVHGQVTESMNEAIEMIRGKLK
jgi:hypothetical protein